MINEFESRAHVLEIKVYHGASCAKTVSDAAGFVSTNFYHCNQKEREAVIEALKEQHAEMLANGC